MGLAGGGKVISISEYLKQKEKPRIKKLNLDALAPGKALSELTDAEREVVRNLLRMTFKMTKDLNPQQYKQMMNYLTRPKQKPREFEKQIIRP